MRARSTPTPPSNPRLSRSRKNLASIEYYATGRRKTSTARVFLRPGTGAITVNHREFNQYFPTETLRMNVRRPLQLTESVDKFDVLATVDGGGVHSQSGAIRLGIARALVEYNAELRKQLKKDGLLTSDSRVKERKKYGMAGARKRFQFSKR
jgi:small subunit ribosomal protein S9